MNQMPRLALLVGLLAFTPVGADESPSAAALFEQGMTEYNQVNYGAALRKFRESADMGHAPAQVMLATLLDASEFNEEARTWYEKAVAQGDVEGQMGLARMLALGDGGDQDLPRAVALYEAAADQGNLEAMRILYAAWRDGDLGLEADSVKALEWLRRGAEAGDQWSQQQLAAQAGN